MKRKRTAASKYYLVPYMGPKSRIIDFAGDIIPLLGSRSAAKKAISSGRLILNGKVANSGDYISKGDKLELKSSGFSKIKPLNVDIDIIYEDDYLLVVNKPGGIAVNGNRYTTVENALAGRTNVSSQEDALPRPIACHRIDVPTKGLVLMAKCKSALIGLGRAFEKQDVHKEYYAVVHGKFEENGEYTTDVDGKKARTVYEVLDTAPSRNFGHLSLLKMMPKTGRTHQLRVHLLDHGSLVVGDKHYVGDKRTILGKGMYLCASKIIFTHPNTKKEIVQQLDLPSKFSKLLEREKERF